MDRQPNASQNIFGKYLTVFFKKYLNILLIILQIVPQIYSPPGFENLATTDKLLVNKKINLLEVITGFKTNTKFTIKNALGQKLYSAVEESNWLHRNCRCSSRSFDMKIMDVYGNEVIHLYRPLKKSFWLPFSNPTQIIEVHSPPDIFIGTIEHKRSFTYPKFDIKNENGEIVFRIEGPFWARNMGDDVKFRIISLMTGTQIGQIDKKWSCLFQEVLTTSARFDITFPNDLDIRMKALMLGACILIDFMLFEGA